MNVINYTVNPKENTYFYIKVFFSILFYGLFAYGIKLILDYGIPPQLTVLLFYVGFIILFLIMRLGLLIGYLKGNAVRINENQLPDIYEIVKKQSAALGFNKVPHVYLMQAGGLLNAFATRFLGTNYVVIYSDILEEAYENNMQTVEFVIGHEMGHVKRKHVLKRLLLFPSALLPFLGSAYSRACEYTCDNIGAALSPKGARSGLLLLAAGKKLHGRINVQTFMQQTYSEDGFWFWFSEKISSHPKLAKRVLQFKDEQYAPIIRPAAVFRETVDHSAYFPKSV